MKMRSVLPWAAGMGVASFCVGSAWAQTDATVLAGTQVYEASFFKQYDLSTAEDMLRRLPGVEAILNEGSTTQARGLGEATEQILINGKRMASKATTAAATLRRIPAAAVQRVELIRGDAGSVQGASLVVNVVLDEGAVGRGQGNFELAYRFSDRGWSDVDGLVSYTGAVGRVGYALGFERSTWSPLGLTPSGGANDYTLRFRDERYFYPDGGLQESRPQKWARMVQTNRLTGAATYDLGGGDMVRLNGVYTADPIKTTDVTDATRFDPGGALTGRAIEFRYNKVTKKSLELGGELEKRVGSGAFNVIALHTRGENIYRDYRVRHEATGPLAELARSGNRQDVGEDVLRLTYEAPINGSHTLTLGVEGAMNFLDQDIEVFFDLDRDGRLEAVSVPTARAHVEEKRAEFTAQHNARLGKWSATSALVFEVSRISTNYDAIPVRTLRYLKPRLNLSYRATSRDQFTLNVERAVGQLDFQNFVPAYNVVDSIIDLGNPEILPGDNRSVDLTYEHRLPDDQGVLSATAFYKNNWGVTAFVPNGRFNSAGLPLSWRGNQGAALFYGAELKSSLRLTRFQLPGATVNTRLQLQRVRVRDPFTHERRKAGTPLPLEFSTSFRHDVPAWRTSYGAEFMRGQGDIISSDIRVRDVYTRSSRVMVFVERALNEAYSIRFDAYSINGATEDRMRRIYAVEQADGRLTRSELTREVRDRRFVVLLRGRF